MIYPTCHLHISFFSEIGTPTKFHNPIGTQSKVSAIPDNKSVEISLVNALVTFGVEENIATLKLKVSAEFKTDCNWPHQRYSVFQILFISRLQIMVYTD